MKARTAGDVVKDVRMAFARLVATAVAIVLTVFAVMGILGVSPLASFRLVVSGSVVGDFFRYLPATLELVVVSYFVASILGLVSALPSARLFKPVITSIALGLQCIPFFWLASAMELTLGVFGRLPIGSADQATLSGHLVRLIIPAVALTMFQFPLVVDYFNRSPARGLTPRAKAASRVAGLALQFVDNLPDIIAAAMITEILLVWPGEGRLFWDSLLRQHAASPLIVGFLLLMALSILATRFLVEVLARRGRQATDSHV